jgi:hypothetical protein
MPYTVLLKHAKNYGIDVRVSKETILKEMAAKIEFSQHFCFDLIQELFDRLHILFFENRPVLWRMGDRRFIMKELQVLHP